eukprot:4570405-Amphidinium_carterae.3
MRVHCKMLSAEMAALHDKFATKGVKVEKKASSCAMSKAAKDKCTLCILGIRSLGLCEYICWLNGLGCTCSNLPRLRERGLLTIRRKVGRTACQHETLDLPRGLAPFKVVRLNV